MKKYGILGIWIFSFWLYGCQGSSEVGQRDIAVSVAKTEAEEKPFSDTSGSSEAVLIFHPANPEFCLATDDPLYWDEGRRIADTENGYYFMEDEILYFWDKLSGQLIPVCNQPSCQHGRQEECDAFFEWRDFRAEQGIWYQNGYLYMLGSTSGFREYSLWRLKADGTGREEVCPLFLIEGEDQTIQSITVHRGYLYYVLKSDSPETLMPLCRVALEGGEIEVLYETTAPLSYIYRIRGYGDGVFFQVGRYMDETYEEFSGGIYYCSDAGEVTDVVRNPEASKFYTVEDGTLYYSTLNEIRVCDLATGEDSLFYRSGLICGISFDKNYIYLDDWYGVLLDDTVDRADRLLTVLDKQGNFITSMNISGRRSEMTLFGDDRYLFMYWAQKEAEPATILKVYDKSRIGTENRDWEILYSGGE